ncbi:hypothetical protein NP493_53g05001 [Ridgeia piscesae]|uniref:Uncharacterized protein n=1 Tax=Ridgeia piscesae TaxID=27915 RepID=A0AAD9PAS2_RIDPI|nr:hypothetical protein NP493_53g05001 [Ridgeia piscesae]
MIRLLWPQRCCHGHNSPFTTLLSCYLSSAVFSARCMTCIECDHPGGSTPAPPPLMTVSCHSPHICSTRRGNFCPWPQSSLSPHCLAAALWPGHTHSNGGQTSCNHMTTGQIFKM